MTLLGTCWLCYAVDVLDEDNLCPRCSVRRRGRP